MALHKCKECGNQVSTKAKTCPSCGAPVKQPTSAATGCLAIMIFGVMIAICAGILTPSNNSPSISSSATGKRTRSNSDRSSSNSTSSTSSPLYSTYWVEDGGFKLESADVDHGDIHGAWAYMQLFVQKRLKSPKSADFPFGGSQHVTDLREGRYRVKSYVDSQNSFGANIRTRFEGVIKRVTNGWELESLTFDE